MANAQRFETEVKLRVPDADWGRQALKRLGALLGTPRHFEDNIFLDNEAGAVLAHGGLLRLRRVGEKGVLTFKGKKQVVEGMKRREEIEVACPDPETLERLFTALGYRTIFRYQKYREVYRFRDVEIVIDETPIGTFLEIEGEIKGIHAAASLLGYKAQDYIADSYASLFYAAGGRGDMLFEPPPPAR
jgi:adenylate cyclase class 2